MKPIFLIPAVLAGCVAGASLTALAESQARADFTPSQWVGNSRFFAAISVATSADGGTVYVADLQGLWKSADGGESWTRLKRDPAGQ